MRGRPRYPLVRFRFERAYLMGITQTKRQIGQLQNQLRQESHAHDVRLLKLALVMVVLAVAAAYMHGKLIL